MRIPLTLVQQVMFQDRLETADAIIEAVHDEHGYHKDDIDAIIGAIEDGLGLGEADLSKALLISRPITKAVIADIIEGNTYLARMGGAVQRGEESEARYSGRCRSFNQLAAKMEEALGLSSLVVPYA